MELLARVALLLGEIPMLLLVHAHVIIRLKIWLHLPSNGSVKETHLVDLHLDLLHSTHLLVDFSLDISQSRLNMTRFAADSGLNSTKRLLAAGRE